MPNLTTSRVALLVLVAAVSIAFFLAGGHDILDLGALKARWDEIERFYAEHPATTLVVFFAFYIALTTLSLPGGAAATLAAGALLGTGLATVLVSFASTIGATLAFLLSRYVLRDWIERRFSSPLAKLNEGIEREGPFYLFFLRLVPAIPFFVVNAGMGLTRMRVWTYYWVSQLGMLAGTWLFASAGAELASIDSPGDVLSLGIAARLVLLGALPLVARKILVRA